MRLWWSYIPGKCSACGSSWSFLLGFMSISVLGGGGVWL